MRLTYPFLLALLGAVLPLPAASQDGPPPPRPGAGGDGAGPFRLKLGSILSCVAVSPDGRTVAAGGVDHFEVPDPEGLRRPDFRRAPVFRLWDTATGREKSWPPAGGFARLARAMADAQAGPARTLNYSPDGRILVVGTLDRYEVRDAATGETRLVLDDGPSQSGAAFSPDGKTMAIPTSRIVPQPRSGVRVVDVDTGREVAWFPRVKGETGQIHAAAFSPDGRLLATAGSNCQVTVWDMGTRAEVFRDDVRWPLNCCRFSPDGRHLVAAGEGGVLRLYTVAAGAGGAARVESAGESARYRVSTSGLVFTPDGRRLLAAGGALYVWEVAGWRASAPLAGDLVALSADGRVVAIGGRERGEVVVGPTAALLK